MQEDLDEKIRILYKIYQKCELCPKRCRVNRLKNQKGFCRAPSQIKLYSYFPHKGEEPPISGKNGSGIVFFSHCNLRCVYCQNYKFSHLEEGQILSPQKLSDIFLELQDLSVHNINLVTATQFLPPILEAIKISKSKGLNLPIVYNTSGYENPEIIEILENVVDIYLADFRYLNPVYSLKFSNSSDYPQVVLKALKKMYEKTGDLLYEDGILKKGLIIRVLVLPSLLEEAKNILIKIKEIFGDKKIGVSLLTQFYPFYKAKDFTEINRRLTNSEVEEIIDFFLSLKFYEGWFQIDRGEDKFSGERFKQRVYKK